MPAMRGNWGRARHDGLDVVITLGGDGTINEAVNGMLADGPGPDVPALATVRADRPTSWPGSGPAQGPGRGHRRPARRTARPALPHHRTRSRDDRWFTMNAGMGLDAEIISAMESQRAAGKEGLAHPLPGDDPERVLPTHRPDNPAITLWRPDGSEVDHVFVCIVQNAAPWTFLGDLPVNPNPRPPSTTASPCSRSATSGWSPPSG